MATSAALFNTVAPQDYLGFWADHTFRAREVADFLDLDKRDVAKMAGVAPASVRFDEKMPRVVLERLQEIANVCDLVAHIFGGDVRKTTLWFKTRNPLLGNISPRDMLRFGRYQRLQRFIQDAIAENLSADADSAHDATPAAAG